MVEPSLELLQVMVQKVLDTLAEHTREFQDIKLRLTHLERSMAAMRRDRADDVEMVVHLQRRVDYLQGRLERLERRLEIQS